MQSPDYEVDRSGSGSEEIDVVSVGSPVGGLGASVAVSAEKPKPKKSQPRKRAASALISDEEDEPADEKTIKRAARVSICQPLKNRRKEVLVVESEEGECHSEDEGESDEGAPAAPQLSPKQRKRRAGGEYSKPRSAAVECAEESDEASKPAGKLSKPKRPQTLSITNPLNKMMANEVKYQAAMDCAVMILTPLKVDIKNLTLLPDQPTIECFTKAAQAWMSEKRTTPSLTYTTSKTFKTMVGRLLFSFVTKHAALNCGNWEPSGLALWRHNCSPEKGLHCFHGTPMISKEHMIEMDLASENAQRALKETPQRTKVVANKWGRQVVQLLNNDAACCPHDVACAPGSFSNKSCGMFYTEGLKALTAFSQICAYQRACYPNMGKSEELIVIPVKCDCNWANSPTPIQGRQICKISPFVLNGLAGVDKSQVEDKRVLASLDNPAVLVFQCCNPVYRGSKNASNAKNCDFKISAPDLITAIQLAKKIWTDLVKTPAPLSFAEFKWTPQLQVQNTVLPIGLDDEDESLF